MGENKQGEPTHLKSSAFISRIRTTFESLEEWPAAGAVTPEGSGGTRNSPEDALE